MSEPTMTVRDEEAEASARGDVTRRGRALYEAKLKAVLEPEYNNRFVAIHPDSGEYAVADSTGERHAGDTEEPTAGPPLPHQDRPRTGVRANGPHPDG